MGQYEGTNGRLTRANHPGKMKALPPSFATCFLTSKDVRQKRKKSFAWTTMWMFKLEGKRQIVIKFLVFGTCFLYICYVVNVDY